MDEHDILELGSVVQIRGGVIPMMIIGYFPFHKEKNEVYDYLCVSQIMGLIDPDRCLMVNKAAIDKVLYHGCKTLSATDFLEELGKLNEERDIKELVLMNGVG
jgi:hypothetical protein